LECHSVLASAEESAVDVSVVLGFAAVDVKGVVAVKLADDVVEQVAVGLGRAGFEALLAGVVQLLEEVFLGRFGDEFLAVLLGV